MNEQRIAVLTDTGTNVPAAYLSAHDVRAVPLRINFSDGSSFLSGVDITTEELISRFDQEIPSTSLPSPAQIRDTIEQARSDGYEQAVFITVSAGLSATNQSVHLVADQMEDFPIIVVNSRSVCISAGMVVMSAVEMVESGISFSQLEGKLDELSNQTRVFFSTKTLDYLRKGGRISEPVYRLGSLLNIKPVLTCDKGGYTVVAKKARGWQRSLDSEVSLAVAHARELGAPVRIAICCSKGNDHFDELEAKLRNELAHSNIAVAAPVVKAEVSPDLLVHSGPDVVAVGIQPFWRW